MEANQVGLALYRIIQTQPGKLAVARVGIIQVDILHRGGDHSVPRNGCIAGNSSRKQEQSGIPHKVLDIVDAELGLDSNVRRAQVVIGVQDVGKSNNRCDILRHNRKLVQNLALGLCKGGLPGGCGAGERTRVQEGVEVPQHHVLELSEKSVVALFHGDLRAILVHVLDGNGLGILLDGQFCLGGLCDGRLAVRDDLASAHVAVLQGYVSGIRDQLRAGGLADRTHDAQDGAQRFPVIIESGDKIHLAGRHAGISVGQRVPRIGKAFNFRSSHLIQSFHVIWFSISAFWRSAADMTYRPWSSFL